MGKYVKYKALSFLFRYIIFSTDSPTEVIRGRIFTQSLKLRTITQGSAFLRILLLPCHVIFLVPVDGIRWGLTYEDMYMRTF